MKLGILLATAALAVAPAALVAVPAAADTVDPGLPTQLPRTAIPRHYSVTVTPHAERLSFDGGVAIDISVVRPTSELTLNAADLAISSASIRPVKGGTATVGKVSLDEAAQTATIAFQDALAAGDYRLEIIYSGKINTQANGLFALDYTNPEGKPARSIFTQFEAADARRFVPSWDEPDYKATFDLIARVPSTQMAVSNMPAATSRAIPGGMKEVRFRTTPVMSSYLLFFAAGDFERVTKHSAGREVGIVVSRGNGKKAQFALDAEAQILPYYNDYFGTPYPLPKLDNVGGPGQSQFFSAMENWGAIFTFERRILNDPAITSEDARRRIFGTEAHEMAHMWFGDLVTMAWWDDLWLNEGFASWMATKTTEHFHPDWNADIDRLIARESAMRQDAFKSTHPVIQQIRTVEQANQAFDDITYRKGQSVIAMLETFAGADVWRAGMRDYIARHAYQNTRTDDLWAAQERAGAKGLTAIAREFTNQPGIPLIAVGPSQCVGGQTVATLTQSQFSNDQRAETAAKPLRWHVPVRSSSGGAAVQIVTNGPTAQIAAAGCGPLLVNAGQAGYFRTLYQPDQLRALVAGFEMLAPVDQYGLLNDQVALARAGYQPVTAGLDVLGAINATSNPKVIQSALARWTEFYGSLDDDPAMRAALAGRVSQTYGPLLARVGFIPRAGEPAGDTIVRETLIDTLGKMGDPTVAAEAKRLFTAWQSNAQAIPGSLKETWLGVIAANADEQTWNALRAKAQAATSSVERIPLYQLLGGARDERLAKRALDLALTSEPGSTVSAGMITSVAANHPRLAVEFVLAHLAKVNKLIDISGRSRFIQRLVESSSDEALIPTLEGYAKANLAQTDRKPVEQAIDRLRFAASTRPAVRSGVADWLAAHPLTASASRKGERG